MDDGHTILRQWLTSKEQINWSCVQGLIVSIDAAIAQARREEREACIRIIAAIGGTNVNSMVASIRARRP